MIVEGKYATVAESGDDLEVRVVNVAPGDSRLVVVLAKEHRTNIPLDNIIKTTTRLDPEHASFTERQIKKLRADLGDANAKLFDMEALQKANRELRIAKELAEKERDELLQERK